MSKRKQLGGASIVAMQYPEGRPPRWYAGYIINMSPGKRQDAVDRVPDELKQRVVFYVNDYFQKKFLTDRVELNDVSKKKTV